jgi:iron complex outermembrane receptor protein
MKNIPGRVRAARAGVSCIPLLWLGVAAAAQAQEAQPAPAPEPAQAETADQDSGEIVIMARRRNEALADAPLSITAVGAEQLREQSLVNVTDLNRVAPNVVLRQTNSGAGTVDAVIRGQSYAISNIANDPPVGLYFDDVIVTQNKGAATGIFDIQSVEVVRGVQGTLRGRNNTGGSISFYTRRPDLDSLSGELSATYGSRNYVQLQGIFNAPVSDGLAVRLGVQRITQDGWGRSIESGQEYGGRDQWFMRAGVLFEPTSDISLYAVYEHSRIDQNALGRRVIPGSQSYNALVSGTRSGVNPSGIQRTPDEIIPADFWDGSTGYIMPNDFAESDFWRGTFRYNISDNMIFKVIAGYRRLTALGGIDLEGSPAVLLESVNGGTSRQFTVEPQLSGELAGGRLNYVLGYYHFNDSGQLVADTYAYSVNNADPANPFRSHIVIREGATNVSDAGYFHLEYSPVDRIELAAGIRYTRDERNVRPNRVLLNDDPRSPTYALYQAGTVESVGCLFTTPVGGVLRPAGGFALVGGNAVASGACPNIELTKTFGFWSYDLSARYRLTDELTIYARHGLGQKAGGINVPITSTVTAPFDPERVRDYEAGLRFNRLGGFLDGSLAVYYSDYKGLQRYVSSLLPGGGGIGSSVINAGSARIWGIEGEFNARVTRQFSINGFFGYTNGKYREFTTTDAGGNLIDLSDQPFFATPKFTSRLGASYVVPFASGDLRFNAGWSHQSNSSLSAIAFPGAESGVVDLVDARIAWTSADNRWELAAYATNLLNDKYFTSASVNRTGVSAADSSATGAYGTQGEPRFFGLSATLRFSN